MTKLSQLLNFKYVSLVIITVLITGTVSVNITATYAETVATDMYQPPFQQLSIPLSELNLASATTDMYPPPFQQLRDGTSIDKIQCNAPRDLYIRDSQIPVCISAETYNILVNRGYSLDPVLAQTYASIIYSIADDVGESEIKYVVEETINMYNANKEIAFGNINDLSENLVSHYPFVLDPGTRYIVAHGADQDRVGIPSLILGDYADKPYDTIIAELQDDDNDGAWVDYVFIDPATNDDGLKRSWLVLHDGYIFGAGFYYPVEEKIDNIINNAIELYKKDGSFDGINAMYTDVTSHYPFVIDPDDNITVAHGAFPDLVGKTSFVNQDVPYSEIVESLEDDTESINQYVIFQNPSAGERTLKHNVFKLYDGYLFGAGYYYSGDEKVKGIVKSTIETYKSDKESAFFKINSQSDKGLNPHYPFVIDPDTKTIVANGGFPTIIGNISLFFSDHANKSAEEITSELNDGNGVWVEYVYNVPGTDFEEKKRSYLEQHDGYIFGSGYYLSTFTVVP